MPAFALSFGGAKEVKIMAEKTVNDENLMGAIAYLLGPITGIVLLVTQKKSQFVRFHAMQSTVVFGGLWLLYIVLGIVPILGWIIAVLISPLFMLGSFVLWIFLMWKAFNGEKFRLPYLGEVAEKQLAKLG